MEEFIDQGSELVGCREAYIVNIDLEEEGNVVFSRSVRIDVLSVFGMSDD